MSLDPRARRPSVTARLVLASIGIGGCNQVLGLDPTEPNEELEVVRECPVPGTTVPRYSRLIDLVLADECYNYTLSETGRALAVCLDDNRLVLEEGPKEGPLAPSKITRTAGESFEDPAQSPEGDLLVVRQFGGTPSVNRFSIYRRDGDGWTWSLDLVDSLDFQTSVGVPSRGPDRRVMHGNSTEVRELAETAGGWTPISVRPWSALGVTGGSVLNLSPDGLRLVFISLSKQMYVERATKAENFGIAREMDTLPEVSSTVFMEENCERVYFSGLSSVFSAHQLPP